MDFNTSNKGGAKRKAQSIQEMINSTPQSGSGLRKSGYAGPKNGAGQRPSGNTTDLSGINVTRSQQYDRWGNSSEGMPKPKKARYKADVGNPMRGNILKRDMEQSKQRLDQKAKALDKERKSKARRSDDFDMTGQLPRTDKYVAPVYKGPLDSFGWIIYSAILMLCVVVTLVVSGLKPRGSGYVYPMNVITISGVVNSAYEHAMGVKGTFSAISGMNDVTSGDGTLSTDTISTDDGNTKVVDKPNAGDLTDLGDEGQAATLDDGSGAIAGITPVSSHSELVSQVKDALATGNTAFIAAKLAYADENSGALNGYPMSQIKHFCEYMTAHPDKLDSFISTISTEEYSAVNGSAYLVKLPIMKFTVKMGESTSTFVLDNTVVSVSGFSDVIVNGNQNAAIYPLLPCIYTVTLTNNAWGTPSQSQEIEATLGEGNLEIKVGQASE